MPVNEGLKAVTFDWYTNLRQPEGSTYLITRRYGMELTYLVSMYVLCVWQSLMLLTGYLARWTPRGYIRLMTQWYHAPQFSRAHALGFAWQRDMTRGFTMPGQLSIQCVHNLHNLILYVDREHVRVVAIVVVNAIACISSAVANLHLYKVCIHAWPKFLNYWDCRKTHLSLER